ncbi:helix-turn-helix domain-containing protein [Streptomyces virginiae]|uniref:helix-turn-helix domain-containing protein n=1 Tax=Streptomyces virginiae TaxID=1961 RepID=UPI00331880AC
MLALAHSQHAGSLVRIGREALGWRQADLGKRLLCSQSAVSRLEQGRTRIFACCAGRQPK